MVFCLHVLCKKEGYDATHVSVLRVPALTVKKHIKIYFNDAESRNSVPKLRPLFSKVCY